MSFLSSIGLGGVDHFLGGLFGGNNDDEKKKQQQQQAAAAKQSASRPALSVQSNQNDQSLAVAPPPQNDVNVGVALKKVNGNNPSPAQLRAAASLKAMGGAPDPNYKSKDPNVLDYAAETAKGVGSSLVKVGNAAAGDVQHLGNVISYPILTHEYEGMRKQGQIDDATALQLENDAGIKAGFKIDDSAPTVLRKVSGAVAGPTATILTAGAAPEATAGLKLLSPAQQAIRAAGAGAALGAGFGGIQTLNDTEPLTLKKTAENVGLGAVSGAALGAVAPTVVKTVGGMIDRLRPPAPVEIAPGVTSGANAAHDLTEHNLGIAQATNIGSVLDTPAYLRNRLALPAPRENVAVPINEGTPEGNLLLNQNKPQISPTGVEVQPAVPAKRVGVLDKTNSRMVASDVIPGTPEKLVTTPGKNVTDIGAPSGSVDPALLQKARNVAIAKATGAENVVPHVPAPAAAPVESLVKRIEHPTGSSDAELLKNMNDLITHPDAPPAVKDWALAERDKLTGVADATAPAAPSAPAPEAPAAVPQNAPSPQPLADVLPAAPEGAKLPGGEPTTVHAAGTDTLVRPEASATAAPDEARQALIDGLKAARTQSMEDASNLSAGRSARAGKMTGAADGLEGQAATDARRAAMGGSFGHRGQYTGIDNGSDVFDALRLQAQKDPELANRPYSLDNVEEALSRATTGKSLDGKTENAAPTDAQINLLRKHFGDDVADAVKEKVDSSRTFMAKFKAAAGELAAAPKAVMASFDMSATLRQGGVLASRFPKEAAAAAAEQVKYFASKNHYETAMKAIEDDPYFEAANKSGLALTGVSSLEQPEEQFIGKIITKVPGIAGSDRAYAGFLTKLRFDTFKNIVDTYAAKGVELGGKELEDVSKFINTASGRGDLGQYLEKHSNTLSTALFSPKLWKSRLDMLNPVYYAKLSGPARKYALQSAATFASAASTVLGLAALAGANVETDVRSSDFGKIKVGNTRYDVLGGFQQNLVFAARELSGESKSSTTGEVTKFAKGVQDIGNPDSADVSTSPFAGSRLSKLTDLVTNKANPLLATAGHFLAGKGIGGSQLNPWAELANLVTPLGISNTISTANDAADLSASDLAGSAKELGKAALKNAPDFFGISAQTYGDVPTKYQPDSGTKTADASSLKKVPDAVQKTLDKRAEKARVEDFKKRDIPENQAGVDQRFQNGEFDKAIEGIKHLEDVANKKEELSVTDKAKYDLQINRAQTMKDKGIKYADFADYNKTTLSEWRSMGNPKSEAYDPDTYQKLFEIDQAFAEGKGSDNSKDPSEPKFSAKAVKSGSGSGGGGSRGGVSSTVRSNTIGNLPSLAKVDLSNLAPQKITAAAKIPTIAQVQPGELIKKRAISVGKA